MFVKQSNRLVFIIYNSKIINKDNNICIYNDNNIFFQLIVYVLQFRKSVCLSSDTPCMYINQAAVRVQPVKEFASRSIEHRTEKRLNAFTVCPSWEEGHEGPRRNVGPRKMHADQVQ